jgi:hypothetical protein
VKGFLRHAVLAERGSAPAEFVMVGALLTMLTLSVLQLGFALHIRNTVIDAAAEGARFAALADNELSDGVTRTQDIISTALSPGYAQDVDAAHGEFRGHPVVIITVHAPLPLLGFAGIQNALHVSGRAALEVLD